MKPFNLEEALAGETVKLKNGLKAYVIKILDSPEIGMHELIGFYETERKRQRSISWFYDGTRCDDFAITGMWEEPKRFINGIEVPKSLTMKTCANGEKYWFVDLQSSELVTQKAYNVFNTESLNLVNRGLAFRRKQDAKAMAKALLNYNVEYKNDDNAYANNGWIDINKQLPPLGTKVIGRCVIDGKVLILIIVKKLVGSEYWFSPVNIYGTFDDKAVDVTHWQPLPKLPQA
ncbi:DUF551 domain-containing protein [Avibacterium paragallinarum]|uniref:DUF551 domain-containing protein n=1 Tax=Avibacterium paragallinarum TaxID=728 RepID=A0A380X3T6_AVIPA|nr:DUF551 domain-containing protein [Avibacterium paragallinarum]KAA6207945.1 DUF551 domain-containing protein [Avibacterium paragallinarum]SUU97347.1 Uncharacterised protein [Avibacterium paragallinarum]